LRVTVNIPNAGGTSPQRPPFYCWNFSHVFLQYLQCKELILRESVRLGGLSREGVLRMVSVELHQNYGSVYEFAVSRCVGERFQLIYRLMHVFSGWVKRTIDPAYQASTPSVTTSAAEPTDAADSLGASLSSLKVEPGTAASESETKAPSEATAI
jgi:hypothetical protein